MALVKDEERYLFLFNDETRAETLRTLGRYASDSALSFSWYDAAVMSQKVRATKKQNEVPESTSMPAPAAPAPISNRFDGPPVGDLLSGEEPIL